MEMQQIYERIYTIIEENPGITSEKIAEMTGDKPARVTKRIYNMANAGFLTYGEGIRHYAMRRTEPDTGRGKKNKVAMHHNGEPVRYGKWI